MSESKYRCRACGTVWNQNQIHSACGDSLCGGTVDLASETTLTLELMMFCVGLDPASRMVLVILEGPRGRFTLPLPPIAAREFAQQMVRFASMADAPAGKPN